jgi:hypothetical protein
MGRVSRGPRRVSRVVVALRVLELRRVVALRVMELWQVLEMGKLRRVMALWVMAPGGRGNGPR